MSDLSTLVCDKTESCDVAIVGASLAGSAAARLFGLAGLNVVLLESKPDISAHKTLCTHSIQAHATPVLQRLGVFERIDRASYSENILNVHTKAGWAYFDGRQGNRSGDGEKAHGDSDLYGVNIPRSVLDPALRELAAETPGVDLRLGANVCDVVVERDRVTGVIYSREGVNVKLQAKLVVAADGRNSRVGKYLGHKPKSSKNVRSGCAATYKGVVASGSQDNSLQFWLGQPEICYRFQNGDLTVFACMFDSDEYEQFAADAEGELLRRIEPLQDAPNLSKIERVGPVIMSKDLTNKR